jgi:pyruvate/2-oxoglutarate dehydrogenase complex dihydrolipoamide acyltransferase (E2) component
MSVELVMPKAGLTMIEGTISSWKVEEGASVKKGDVVMEFENEKTTMECEANEDGILHIAAQAGEVVKVGEPVAIIAATKKEYESMKNGGAAPQTAVQTAPTTASVDAAEVVMPKAGLTMIEGVVGEWKVAEGKTVKKGQAIFDFENEKTTMECEATSDGILHQVAKTGIRLK